MSPSKKNPAKRPSASKPSPKKSPPASRASTSTRTVKAASKGKAAAAPAPREDRAKLLERAIEEAREHIEELVVDRDNHVALAEAADAEREIVQGDLDRARERIRQLEEEIERRGAAGSAPADAEDADEEIEFDAEEAESAGAEDLDDVETVYQRMDDSRVRRRELDRERMEREDESGHEKYWMICPKCGDNLEEIESDDVKMDRCESCGGIYFDHGEAEMIVTLSHTKNGLARIRNIFSY